MWYERNREYHKANVLKRNQAERIRVQAYIKEIKEVTPCADCGKNYPAYVMDFDHLRDKSFQIGRSGFRFLTTVKREIAKCDIVCSNCHRERTHKRGLLAETE